MRFNLSNLLVLGLLVSTAAHAQQPLGTDDRAPSHYRAFGAQRVASESDSSESAYVFPARQSDNAVRQAAWNAEPEIPAAPAEPSRATAAAPDPGGKPLRLAPRSKPANPSSATRTKPLNSTQALGTVGGSLALVLGVFLLFAWLLRKHMPAAAAPLPKEVVEMLGRAPLLGRQQLSLLRVGNKLVLLAVSPLGGAEAITEITDPAEVDRLIGLCQSARSGSVATSFRQALTDLGGERASGFLGAEERPRRRAAT